MSDFSPPVPTLPAASVPAARTHSLYRKYRPQTFDADDLVGQEHIVRILRNAIRLDRISHAYLFCGPRGTGKTTTARLLAKAVNCLDPDPDRRPCNQCASCLAISNGSTTDVIEIDAASNRGIDDIRDLRDRVKYAPVQLHTKFYIVDEAHQITGAAANAFLKTLEEPPAHTKFVLATTDPEELLPTIVSRCQRFDFRRIGYEAAVARLRTVAAAEGLLVDEEALAVIARQSTGSLRDGLSLLDQLALYVDPAADDPRVTVNMVHALLGISRNDRVEALVAAVASQDAATALRVINSAVDAGEDPRQINRQLVAYLRLLLHQRAGAGSEADETARALAARFELAQLADLSRRFNEIDFAIKTASLSHLPLEIAFVQAIAHLTDAPQSGARPAAPQSAQTREVASPPTPAVSTATPAALSAPGAAPAVSLRDRVRGAAAPRPLAPPAASAIHEEPATTAWQPAAEPPAGPTPQVTALPPTMAPVPVHGEAPTPAPAPSSAVVAPFTGELTIEQIADLWPRVRQDVKALNRRIEALLASADPGRVAGETVILAAAYPFHRDKLNTDEVRGVLESVLSRLCGRPLNVTCVLRGELPPEAPAAPGHREGAASPPVPPPSVATPSAGEQLPADPVSATAGQKSTAAPTASLHPDGNGSTPAHQGEPATNQTPETPDAADEQRLTAARNIFDADIISDDG